MFQSPTPSGNGLFAEQQARNKPEKSSDEQTKIEEEKDLRAKKNEARALLGKQEVATRVRQRMDPERFPTGLFADRNSRARLVPNPIKEEQLSVMSTASAKPLIERGSDIVDFLFGSEMGIMGIAHDTEGYSWNIENMKQQWSEEPLWQNLLSLTSLAGTIVFPAVRALSVSGKIGKIASLTGKLGTATEELSKFKTLGMVDESVKSLDELRPDILKLLRNQEISRTKFEAMSKRADLANKGELDWSKTPWERLKFEFDRRFGNSYFKLTNDYNEGTNFKDLYHDRLNDLWKAEDIGQIFSGLPDEANGDKIYAYMLDRIAPGTDTGGLAAKISAKDKVWADALYDRALKHQQEALKSGFISPETYRHVGEAHLPALLKGTMDTGFDTTRKVVIPLRAQKTRKQVEAFEMGTKPRKGFNRFFGKDEPVVTPEGEVEYIALNTYNRPRLDSPTLMTRQSSAPEIYQRLANGQLITDPAELTLKGYVMDRLLLHNFKFMTDIATDSRFIASADEIAQWGGDAEKAYKAGFVSLHSVGDGIKTPLKNMIAKKTGEVPEELPWIRKAVFDEMFGQDGMIGQTQMAASMLEFLTAAYKTAKTSGSIPTHMQNIMGNFIFLSQAGMNPLAPENIDLMTKLTKTFGEISRLNQAAKEAGVSSRRLFDAQSGLLKGVNLGKIKIGKRTFDLNDELLNPQVRDLIEESAFQTVEASGLIHNMLGRLRKDQHLTRFAVNSYMKTKDILQLGGKVEWFDAMTRAYLAEDMVPKMAMFMKLRGEGLSRAAAIIETGRRLPMYSTVGSSIKYGRKLLFPWATFPTEALRITKNNLMDNPIRMMPWLRLPQILQSVAYSTGISGDPNAVAEAKRQLPFWAQKPTTIVTEGKGGAAVGGGLSGALAGAITGGIATRSAAGAAVGGALGLAAGSAGAVALTDEDHEKALRGAVLDFLPHSSFMLTTTSKDFGTDTVPFKDWQGFLEQMPAEPLAIMKPFLNLAEGKTAYGQEIGAEDTGDMISKGIAGLIGFVSPPLIQKYGFKLTTPEVPLFKGPGSKIFNVERLLTDTGIAVDPLTGKPGSLSHDFFLNNFGVWRSYSGSSEQQLANESLTEEAMGKVRSYLTRNLTFFLENGDDAQVIDILSKIQGTFSQQFNYDPKLADKKYHDWLETKRKDIGKHPKLRNWSEEEIISRLRSAHSISGETRSQARIELMNTLKRELVMRRMERAQQAENKRRGL